MTQTQLIETMGPRIAVAYIQGNQQSPFTMDEAQTIVSIAESSPFAGFKFTEELAASVAETMNILGAEKEAILSAMTNLLSCLVILFSTKLAATKAQAMLERDPHALEKFGDQIFSDLAQEMKEADIMDEATKEKLFSGLDFDMKWDDSIDPS